MYVVMGNPIPLARHRHMGRRTWDSQKQEKLVWGINVRNQHFEQLGDTKYEGPLHLDIIFFFPIPKTSVKRAFALRGAPHVYTPDIDNCIKWVLDVSTGILFKDDCIIASLNSRKVYDEKPRTEFTITRLI